MDEQLSGGGGDEVEQGSAGEPPSQEPSPASDPIPEPPPLEIEVIKEGGLSEEDYIDHHDEG